MLLQRLPRQKVAFIYSVEGCRFAPSLLELCFRVAAGMHWVFRIFQECDIFLNTCVALHSVRVTLEAKAKTQIEQDFAAFRWREGGQNNEIIRHVLNGCIWVVAAPCPNDDKIKDGTTLSGKMDAQRGRKYKLT